MKTIRRLLHYEKNIKPPVKCPQCRELTTIIVIDKGNGIRICWECAVKEKWVQ